MSSSENAIEIDSLVKKFGDFTAVNNISLKIKKGEIFGILGPNGAGKTTTINVILGLLKPNSGKVYANGMDISKNTSEIKKLIGLMTQETVVEGDLSAVENLEIFARLYHVPEEEIPARIKEALEEAELTSFADKKAGTFSGGMKRRLELVKSMIQHPRILILDEPTTGLDIQNRTNMWGHIRDLNKEGVTIILTTQYLEEADALCDRLAIIDHGKIKAMGTVSELKRIVGAGRILEIIVEDKSDAEAVASMLKSHFKLAATVKIDKITAIVESNQQGLTAKILNELDHKKIKIAAINLHMPTLDDVFIKLTGSAMRDAVGENTGGRNAAMMKGFGGR